MNERTATVFAIWYSRHGHSFLNEALAFDAWQAAWTARGKRDAEVCRKKIEYQMPIPCPDGIEGCAVFHSVPARREKTGEECAQAIEEQA